MRSGPFAALMLALAAPLAGCVVAGVPGYDPQTYAPLPAPAVGPNAGAGAALGALAGGLIGGAASGPYRHGAGIVGGAAAGALLGELVGSGIDREEAARAAQPPYPVIVYPPATAAPAYPQGYAAPPGYRQPDDAAPPAYGAPGVWSGAPEYPVY